MPQHESLFKATAILKVFPFSQVYLGNYSADKRWNRKAIGALVTNERKLRKPRALYFTLVGNTIKRANDFAD